MDGEPRPEAEIIDGARFLDGITLERLPIGDARPHPRNYQKHPPDQIEHLAASIREHGVYRNVVVARDGTILAGHGVVEALRSLGATHVEVYRVDVDPNSPQALKILTGDNEISHLADRDDRGLTELLREIAATDVNALLGTGFDSSMLANLVFVTRPSSEIATTDHAGQWVGLPGYAEGENTLQCVVNFQTRDDRRRFAELLGIEEPGDTNRSRSVWWPPRPKADVASIRAEG